MATPMQLPVAMEKNVTMLSILGKSILLLLASVIVGAFLSLSMTARAQTPLPERVAVLEGRMSDNRDVMVQLRGDLANLRAVLDMDRQKIDDIQSKLSVITGIGIGLSSIMMILQLVNMISGVNSNRRRERDPHE